MPAIARSIRSLPLCRSVVLVSALVGSPSCLDPSVSARVFAPPDNLYLTTQGSPIQSLLLQASCNAPVFGLDFGWFVRRSTSKILPRALCLFGPRCSAAVAHSPVVASTNSRFARFCSLDPDSLSVSIQGFIDHSVSLDLYRSDRAQIRSDRSLLDPTIVLFVIALCMNRCLHHVLQNRSVQILGIGKSCVCDSATP